MAKAKSKVTAKVDDVPADNATLVERILWVRNRVGTLGKDAQVGTGGSTYKAITHDKVTRYLRPKLCQAGIFTAMTCVEATDADTGAVTGKGRKIVQHRAVFEITFANAHDSGDKLTVRQFAYADDYGDKAPGKAASYAMKYALLKMFMVETGEDDEERIREDARTEILRDDEDKMLDLFACAEEEYGSAELAAEKLLSLSQRRFRVENYGQIPMHRLPDAIRSIRNDAAAMREKGEL